MNATIMVMFLSSIGFILIGIFLLNNKYVKNNSGEEKNTTSDIKSIKISGYVNIIIGIIGSISSVVCLFNSSLIKVVLIIFLISIIILSSTQYIVSKTRK